MVKGRWGLAAPSMRPRAISWGVEGGASSPLVEAPKAPDRRACHRGYSRRLEQAVGLGTEPLHHAREGDGLAHVVQAADPGQGPLQAEPESGVGNRPELAQVEVPGERLAGQLVLVDGAQQ